MRTPQKLNGKFFSLFSALALGVLIALTATATHAGFQWVPPAGQPQQQPSSQDMAATPAVPAPTDDVEKTVLPMPGEQPVVVPAQPHLNHSDAAALNAAPPTQGPLSQNQTLQLPPGFQQPQPVPENIQGPAQQNVMHVKNVTPPAPSLQPQAPILLQPLPPPAAIEPAMVPPPRASAPTPIVTSTKVIMPQDAPQTAMDNTPNSQKLVINPYPGINEPPSIPAVPATSPTADAGIGESAAAPLGNFATVEGFGSDMPLALALQQIVPDGYAYSFDPGINPAQNVSWEGGKPWNEIVASMVAPLNLAADFKGNVVHIRPQNTQQGALDETKGARDAALALMKRTSINDPGEEIHAQVSDEILNQIQAAAGEEAVKTTQEPGPLSIAEEKIRWEAKAGESLKDTLTRWSEKAGMEMIWMASYDYTLKQDISVEKDFATAVQNVVAVGIDTKNGAGLQVVQNPADDAPESLIIKDKT